MKFKKIKAYPILQCIRIHNATLQNASREWHLNSSCEVTITSIKKHITNSSHFLLKPIILFCTDHFTMGKERYGLTIR